MNAAETWLPLFPLDLVLLPGTLLPLHVFEPRYRALTRRSLESSEPFGVVRLHGGNVAAVGCQVRIVQVLQAYPDGRFDILIRGTERFSVLDLREHGDGYLEARAAAVQDEPGSAPDPQDSILLERLFREYVALSADDDLPDGASPEIGAGGTAEQVEGAEKEEQADAAGGRPEEPDSDAGTPPPSFTLAARMPLSAEERQALLEMVSERERASAVLGHLARLVPRLRQHEKSRRKIRGNGKPIPSEE